MPMSSDQVPAFESLALKLLAAQTFCSSQCRLGRISFCRNMRKDMLAFKISNLLNRACMNSLLRATYASLLRRCSRARALQEGKRAHAEIVRFGLTGDGFLGDLLVEMYGKCGNVENARAVFDGLPRRNVFSWTVMIAAYAQNGHPGEALDMYRRMDVEPDAFVFATVLGACSSLAALAEGKALHSRITDSGLGSNVVVQNALLNMYAKCGNLDLARGVFEAIQQKDVISWTTMIAAYAQDGHNRAALQLYHRMDLEGGRPNAATFASVLTACSSLGAALEGKAIHSRVAAEGLESSVATETALVDMYANCGMLDTAARLFERTRRRNNVAPWNAMITAYAQHGHHKEALDLYEEMNSQGLQPNGITFAGALCACSNLGALETGKKIHTRIDCMDGETDLVVQNALVHMYAKCGSLNNARMVFDKMPVKDVVSWTGMIAAHTQQGDGNEALNLSQLMGLEGVQPDRITFISILIACIHAGLLKEGRSCFVSMVGDYSIVPIVEHYLCMIDLLGRLGRLSEVEDLINSMPFQPDVLAWTMLLAACKTHGDVERGRMAMEQVIELDPDKTSPYMLLANMCSGAGSNK